MEKIGTITPRVVARLDYPNKVSFTIIANNIIGREYLFVSRSKRSCLHNFTWYFEHETIESVKSILHQYKFNSPI